MQAGLIFLPALAPFEGVFIAKELLKNFLRGPVTKMEFMVFLLRESTTTASAYTTYGGKAQVVDNYE